MTRPTKQDVLWMGAGAAILAVLMLVVWHFRRDESPAQQLASKAARVDLVAGMELALARAAEAEKSAVLAITDEDSRTFADQARSATAEVDQKRTELGKLLEPGGSQREKDLLAQFSQVFGDLRRVDDEVLQLAVKNTNLKAYALLFGPAADTLASMHDALARAVATADAKEVMVTAFGAETAALRIQVLLAPHIAEESDSKMDQLEASMRKEEIEARKDLGALAATLKGNADLAMAASSFGRYEEIKSRILALSRENTNVRSLALSLNQKRKATLLCLESLNALKQAVLEEPIAGVTYGRPPSPR
jgi:hypothetical protein